MRQLSRARPGNHSRSWLAALFGALALAMLGGAGCAAAPPRHHHRLPLEDDDPPPPQAKVEPWSEFGLLSTFVPVGEPRMSGHRLGDEVASLRINGKAAGYPQKLDLAEGATIVEALAPDRSSPTTSYFVMTKRQPGYFPGGGDWDYRVVDAKGGTLASGQLPKCARCHAEAQRGFLFATAKLTPTPAPTP